MSYYPKKKKKVHVQIIPMIDLLTILLIFFVLTTTWRKSESHIKVNLPKASQIANKSVKTIKRVIISVTEKGEIYIGKDLVKLSEVSSHIEKLKKENTELKLELKADGNTSLQILVSLWDSLKKSGYDVSDMPTKISVDKVKK